MNERTKVNRKERENKYATLKERRHRALWTSKPVTSNKSVTMSGGWLPQKVQNQIFGLRNETSNFWGVLELRSQPNRSKRGMTRHVNKIANIKSIRKKDWKCYKNGTLPVLFWLFLPALSAKPPSFNSLKEKKERERGKHETWGLLGSEHNILNLFSYPFSKTGGFLKEDMNFQIWVMQLFPYFERFESWDKW